MFFYISKILWFFAQPSNAMLILLLAGIAMLWSRWGRAGRRVTLLAGLLLLVTGLSPLGHALILPLEERFPRTEVDPSRKPDGIIILGGAQDMSIYAARKTIAVNEAAERLIEAARLAREFPEARLVFSGGSNAIFGDRVTEAEGARTLLTGLGIEPSRIMLEDKSRNTYQNARYTRELLGKDATGTWLLITSASHMPRSVGSFRANGMTVKAWPVDYRTRGKQDLWRFFPKPSEGWRRVDLAMREWIGLLVYRLTGRTSAFLPAPNEQ